MVAGPNRQIEDSTADGQVQRRWDTHDMCSVWLSGGLGSGPETPVSAQQSWPVVGIGGAKCNGRRLSVLGLTTGPQLPGNHSYLNPPTPDKPLSSSPQPTSMLVKAHPLLISLGQQ